MDAKDFKETKEKNETKDSVGAVQNYIVQPVLLPILPVTGTSLPETFCIDAAYVVATGELDVLVSFMIPGDINANQVSIKQYYDVHDENKLQFYAVYGSESSVQAKEVKGRFKASATDAAGNPIDLGCIRSIMTMLVNTVGPKTSRGTVSSVRTTGE